MANHQTAVEQRKLDAAQWPEGDELFGYQIWMHEAKTRYKIAQPAMVMNGVVVNETAFTKWIGEEVRSFLGL